MEHHAKRTTDDQRILIDRARMGRFATVTVRDGRGALVVVEEGSAWLTQGGDVRDILVGAGDWFRLDRDGLALIEGLPSVMITLTAGEEQTVPEITLTGNYTTASGIQRDRIPSAASALEWYRPLTAS